MAIDVYAVLRKCGVVETTRLNSFIRSLLVSGLLLFCLVGDGITSTQQDLQNKINELNLKLTTLEGKTNALAQDQGKLIQRYTMTNAPVSPVSILGTATGVKGQNVQLTLSFIPGPQGTSVAGLQLDLGLPPAFVLVSVTPGPAAIVAGKSVVASGGRILVIGISNQTSIDAGVLAFVTVKSAATTPSGIYPITISLPVATDGNGQTVPLVVTSGWVKIQ